MTVNGVCDEKFAGVRAAFEHNFAAYDELGASVCLSVNGQKCVDLWGGIADADTGDAWEEHTKSIVFSCTKAATAICAHILVDRGALDLNEPVATYWPEFARNGKENTTVQMMLNHEAGVPALREPVKQGGFADWDYMVARLADETPFWEPGTRNGYHAITFGWIVGELVRRISGKSLGQFFQDEVMSKVKEKFWIGVPEDKTPHLARIVEGVPDVENIETSPMKDFVMAMMTPETPTHLAFLNLGGWGPNAREYYKAEIGGAGGITNARGQVAMYTPLACNDGSLISPEHVTRMSRASVATSHDAVLRVPTRFAFGFMKSMDNRGSAAAHGMSVIMGDKAFGHVGAGGSIGFADPECGLAFSYTMNRMGDGLLLNERGQALVDAAYQALGYSSNASGAWVK